MADSLVAQANAAQLEIDEERNKVAQGQLNRFPRANKGSLPWDSEDETKSILSQELMENILALSLCDRNFTDKPLLNLDLISFDLNDFAPVIMKLLEIDSNLAATHARVSPNMSEEEFWMNYYVRIQFLRKRSGIDGNEAQKEYSNIDESKVVFHYTSPEPSTVGSSSTEANKSIDDVDIVLSESGVEDAEIAKRREAEIKLQKEVTKLCCAFNQNTNDDMLLLR